MLCYKFYYQSLFSLYFQFVTYLHFVWITPVQMVATMYLLWIQLGVSCFVPLALMLLLILYQSRLGRVFAMLRSDLESIIYHHFSTNSFDL